MHRKKLADRQEALSSCGDSDSRKGCPYKVHPSVGRRMVIVVPSPSELSTLMVPR